MLTKFPLLAVLLIGLVALATQGLSDRYCRVSAATSEDKFEDFAELSNGGGVVAAIAIKEKAGFTIVPVEADNARTKVCVSFGLREEERKASDFKLFAVDAAGMRHEAKPQSGALAAGKGVMVVTLVADFKLSNDKIDAFVIQQRGK